MATPAKAATRRTQRAPQQLDLFDNQLRKVAANTRRRIGLAVRELAAPTPKKVRA